MPRRVRCSPLKRDREIVADVVATEWIADPRGIRERLTVAIDGHRFRVDGCDVTEIEYRTTNSKRAGGGTELDR